MVNLDEILDDVRAKYHRSVNLRRPTIAWSSEPWLAFYGKYDHDMNHITISSALNDGRVTRDMVALVVYHESLHQDFADHDRRFNAKLKLFPDYDTQDKVLKAFCDKRQAEMEYRTKYNNFLLGKSRVIYIALPYRENYPEAFVFWDEKICVDFKADIPTEACRDLGESLAIFLVENQKAYHIVAWCTRGEILTHARNVETSRFGGLDFSYQMITDYDNCWVVPLSCCLYTIDKASMPMDFTKTNVHISGGINEGVLKDVEFMDTYSDGFEKIGFDSATMNCLPGYEALSISQLHKLIRSETGFRGVWLANAICEKEDSFDAAFNRADAQRFNRLLTAAAREMERAHRLKPSDLTCVAEMLKLYAVLDWAEKARTLWVEYRNLLDLEHDEHLRNAVRHATA